MDEQSFRRLVLEVVQRVVVRLGADGSRGSIAVVLTGATSAFSEAIMLLRQLILDGFRLQLAFSSAARSLYRDAVFESLAGYPYVSELDDRWLPELKKARLVAVPLFSVNTLSKLALLVADSLPGNIVLHALFMGKPVLVAVDGVHPEDPDRKHLGFESPNAALRAAVFHRLETVARYGCVLSDLRSLRAKILQAAEAAGAPLPGGNVPSFQKQLPWSGRHIITASDVRRVSQANGVLTIPAGARLTPLARELAERYGVQLQDLDYPSNRKERS